MNNKYTITTLVVIMIIGSFLFWNNTFSSHSTHEDRAGFSLESRACQELMEGKSDEEIYLLLRELSDELARKTDAKDIEILCLARLQY